MATYTNSSPTNRNWLDIENFSVISHNNGTGRIGQFIRGAGTSYTDETLLLFDVSSIEGGTVNSVTLEMDCDNAGAQTFGATARLIEQDKTDPDSWSSPPLFNDFAQTNWSNVLQTKNVTTENTYTFATSSALVTYVQTWLNDSDNNWGLVIDAGYGATTWWLSVDSVTLTIDYTPASLTQFIMWD